MKMGYSHQMALSTYAIKILKEQSQFCIINNGFVFPSFNRERRLHRDSLNKEKLLKIGISDETTEIALLG